MDYSYSYDEECYHGQFDTPEAAAAEVFASDPHLNEIWVGENKGVTAHAFIDADDVLENSQQRADEHAGECAGDWLSGLGKEKRAALEVLIGDWLQENEPPCFWTIENPRKVSREQVIAAGLLSEQKAA
jgi:hypothetical protein